MHCWYTDHWRRYHSRFLFRTSLYPVCLLAIDGICLYNVYHNKYERIMSSLSYTEGNISWNLNRHIVGIHFDLRAYLSCTLFSLLLTEVTTNFGVIMKSFDKKWSHYLQIYSTCSKIYVFTKRLQASYTIVE